MSTGTIYAQTEYASVDVGPTDEVRSFDPGLAGGRPMSSTQQVLTGRLARLAASVRNAVYRHAEIAALAGLEALITITRTLDSVFELDDLSATVRRPSTETDSPTDGPNDQRPIMSSQHKLTDWLAQPAASVRNAVYRDVEVRLAGLEALITIMRVVDPDSDVWGGLPPC
jgi:hypothetical protein